MRTRHTFLATLLLFLTPCARASYFLQDEWIGEDFYQGWNWETEDDPTHGRVNYISQAEAQGKNLTYGAVFTPRLPSSVRLFAESLYLSSGERGVLHACGRYNHRSPHRSRT